MICRAWHAHPHVSDIQVYRVALSSTFERVYCAPTACGVSTQHSFSSVIILGIPYEAVSGMKS